jgi:hypothetical protein
MQNFTILAVISFFIFPIFTEAAVEISDGSVKALYHLDGDSVDSSGNGHNGTDTSITYGPGKLDDAATFNVLNAKISTADSADFDFGSGDFTISLWVNFVTTGNNKFMGQSQGSGANPKWVFGTAIINSGRLEFYDETNGLSFSQPWTPSTGVWYYVVLKRTGNLWEGFVDNSSIGSQTSAVTIPGVASAFTLGYLDGGVNDMKGSEDELVIIKGAALSTSTISALWNSGTGDTVCVSVGCGDPAPTSSTSTAEEVFGWNLNYLFELFTVIGAAAITYKIAA